MLITYVMNHISLRNKRTEAAVDILLYSKTLNGQLHPPNLLVANSTTARDTETYFTYSYEV